MTTAIYIRVSTAEQTLSVEAQEAAALRYVALRELVDARLSVDLAVSGSVPLDVRPSGATLEADIMAGDVSAVVAVRLDRLFRDTADALITLRRWDASGVALHLLDMGGAAVDTSSAIGRFMLTCLAGMAEFERQLIAERTAAALAAKRARGEYTGGAVPWGFRAEDGKLFPSAMERLTVDIVEAQRAQGSTWRAIATQLNGRDLTNRGRPWRHDTLIRRIGGYRRRADEAQQRAAI